MNWRKSALVDGCGTFSVLMRILLPSVRPGLITVGLFAFLAAWNDFFAPLILLTDSTKQTLPLAVANLRQQTMGAIDYGATESGVVVMAPALPDPLPALSSATTCEASCPEPSRVNPAPGLRRAKICANPTSAAEVRLGLPDWPDCCEKSKSAVDLGRAISFSRLLKRLPAFSLTCVRHRPQLSLCEYRRTAVFDVFVRNQTRSPSRIRHGEKVDDQIQQPQAADGVAKPRSPGVTT